MTTYTTCRGCLVDRHKCENRKKIASAIKGMGVASIKFTCPERLSRFQPGQRVTVMWKFMVDNGDYGGGLEEVSFKATVLKEHKPGRFQIKVDDGPCYSCDDDLDSYTAPDCLIGNGYATATYSRLKSLDEPIVPICSICGGVGDKNDCWLNPQMDEGCLLAKARGEAND